MLDYVKVEWSVGYEFAFLLEHYKSDFSWGEGGLYTGRPPVGSAFSTLFGYQCRFFYVVPSNW